MEGWREGGDPTRRSCSISRCFLLSRVPCETYAINSKQIYVAPCLSFISNVKRAKFVMTKSSFHRHQSAKPRLTVIGPADSLCSSRIHACAIPLPSPPYPFDRSISLVSLRAFPSNRQNAVCSDFCRSCKLYVCVCARARAEQWLEDFRR